MNSILYQLYSDSCGQDLERDEKQQELYSKLCKEWDKVQAVFGGGFVDHMFSLEGELEDLRGFDCWRRGFRMGVRLMLESIMPA